MGPNGLRGERIFTRSRRGREKFVETGTPVRMFARLRYPIVSGKVCCDEKGL